MQQLLTGKTRLPGFSGAWETISLGELERRGDIRLFRGKVISQRDIDRLPGDYPIYSSSIHSNGLFGSYGEYMFDEELITWSVDGGGHFFHRPKHRFSVTNVCGYLRIRTSSVDYRYLAYQLQNLHSQMVFDYTVKAHPSVIRGAYRVALPQPSEQRAIAAVLSDVDGLLGALEKLIAKKRAIKQAVMQQLLTGKTRLPGFSGAWERRRIGDLLYYERPDRYIVQCTEYSDYGNVPVLTANKSFILGYTDEDFGICTNIPVIVFDDFTTDCKYATSPFKVKSSAIKLLRVRQNQAHLRYVFNRMQLIHFPLGDHKRYYISDYQNIELPVPDFNEQRAIAAVLSDMDAEIAALERRRDKTRAIKQGMMQQLLTGQVRLVKPE